MKIIRSIAELQLELGNYTLEQIGLVPTMGCLHEGHLSLIRKAKLLSDIVVVSIYVNPLQFAAHEDLDSYPKPFADDAELCLQEGVDIIFHPTNLYPEQGIAVGLHVQQLNQQLCGASRLGHFDGVATVVCILLNIIRPSLAIFGEKDFQQLSIIRRMVSDLYMPIEIITGETIRETDGLAKSSRNRYLNALARKKASHLFGCLTLVREKVTQGLSIPDALSAGLFYLQQQDIQPEYLSICSEHTLQPANQFIGVTPLRIFIAANIGSARLIDNIPLYSTNKEKEIKSCV